MLDQLSIIIPTLNEEAYIGKLLDSITKQYFKGKLQVIIVDGNSQDKTVAVVKKYKKKIPELLLVETKRRGHGYQRNKGAEEATYKYLLFLDADAMLGKDHLNRLAQKIDTRRDFVYSAYAVPAEKDFWDLLFMSIVLPLTLLFNVIDPLVGGWFVLTTKRLHMRIHGFDERMTFGEDRDYGERAIATGAKYGFLVWPFIWLSARRARKIGRVKLMFQWLSGYAYAKTHGPITSQEQFSYPFGHYSGKKK